MSAAVTGRVVVYVDGACHPNPGPGGYGVVVLGADGRPSLLAEGYGGAAETNNRMEIAAAIAALALTPGLAVEVRSDSEHVVKGVNEWLAGWKTSGWRAGGGGDVANRDLWRGLDQALAGRDATFTWVRGHARDPWNELADEIAVDAKRARGRLGTRVLPEGHETAASRERAAKAASREARRAGRERAVAEAAAARAAKAEEREAARARKAADRTASGRTGREGRVGSRVRPEEAAGAGKGRGGEGGTGTIGP